MEKKILGLLMGLMLIGINAFAADGDLVVNGNVTIGTAGLALGNNGTIASKRADGNLYVNYSGMGDGTADTIFMDGGTTNILMLLTSTGHLAIGNYPAYYPLTITKNGLGFVGNYVQLAEFRDSTPNKGISMGYDSSTQTGIILAASNAASSNIAFWNFDSVVGWGERMRIANTGNVGIGTASPDYILTIPQYSATDPKADSWTTYDCDRTTKEIIRTLPDQSGVLDQLLGVALYEWKRKPIVSDYEIQNQFWKDKGAVDLEKRTQDLAAVKSTLPKFQAKRLGVMLDDPNIPDEIISFDKAGNREGLDLVGYIGWLHATIKELALRVQQLEKR
ncbi:MAG: hypothetical protein ACE144_10280 [Thermodesulfobacteriota bacterium]